MASAALRDTTVKNYKPGTDRIEVPDGGMPGLYLIVQTSGFKSWAYRYTFGGKKHKMTVGDYPTYSLAEARDKVAEYKKMVKARIDPKSELKRLEEEVEKAEAARLGKLMPVMWADYIRLRCKGNDPKYLKEKERMWRNELQPRLGDKAAYEVTRADIVEMVDDIADRGAEVWANRVLSMTNTFFNWLLARGTIPFSPSHRIPMPAEEVGRDRALDVEEVRLFWKACSAIGYPFGDMGKLLLLTGTRLREAAEATRKEFPPSSTELGWRWIIPGERTKNGVSLTLPLPVQVVSVIQSLPIINGAAHEGISGRPSKYLFTTTGDSPVSGFSRAKTAIRRKMMEIAKQEADERGEDPDTVELDENWRFHDLRRTAATFMASLGHQPYVVEAVLNHQEELKGVARIYNQYSFAAEKAAALKDWADQLDKIVAGEKMDNVVSMFRTENVVMSTGKKKPRKTA